MELSKHRQKVLRKLAKLKRIKRIKGSRLFFTVFIRYAFLLIVFALVLGTTYTRLYNNATKEDYYNELKVKADGISSRLNAYIRNNDYDNCFEYLKILSEVVSDEIWTISSPYAENPMDSNMVNVDLADVKLAKEPANIIEEAFHNNSSTATYYSEIHGCTIITVGVPITGKDGKVCGALLINVPLTTIDKVEDQSTSIILVSVIFAAGVSIIIAYSFSKNLTKPIFKMKDTALKLSKGDYDVKTHICRKDELGQLANSLDLLSMKLQENEVIRNNLEQMRLDFFANVSHELRTPITVVRAYTESLLDGIVTDDNKKVQYYERMLKECKSMERLVGDLLLLSKMQNPDFSIEKEPVNVNQIFDEISRSVKHISDEKNIHVKVNTNSEVCLMFGDYDRLRQMFIVILDNAVKFSSDNATIYINICKTDKLRISIKDEGIGISKEELPNIFNKFYKSKLRQNAKGSGLGLAIARQIALKHDGEIEVESEPGVGTTFTFIFDFITDEELKKL